MFNYFLSLNPILQALLGGLFSFLFTLSGSSIIFLFRSVRKNMMNSMLALAAGIMLAASFFSLLNPAIEISNQIQQNILFVFLGFLVGGGFIFLCNIIFSKISFDNMNHFNIQKCIILFTSITLHNIPEGLAIGVAFGSILYGNPIISALSLTLGIAVQNFPEGAAVSLPMRNEGMSCIGAFLFGMISGLVEPIFAVVGALMVLKINIILPFVLSFAAGAMLYVTVLELIPECISNKKKDLMAFIILFGFSTMMILEVLLG